MQIVEAIEKLSCKVCAFSQISWVLPDSVMLDLLRIEMNFEMSQRAEYELNALSMCSNCVFC